MSLPIGHFVGHPMVGAAIEVMFPGPFVFEGHELIDIDGVAVDQPLFGDFDSFVCSSRLFTCMSCVLHIASSSYWQLSQPSPRLHAFGVSSSRSTSMLLEADLFFIQRGCRPRLLMSIDRFFNLRRAESAEIVVWSSTLFPRRACTFDGVFCRLAQRDRG